MTASLLDNRNGEWSEVNNYYWEIIIEENKDESI